MKSQRNADRVQAADRTVASVGVIEACPQCGEACWVAKVILHGAFGGKAYTTHALHVGHLEQGAALAMIGRWLMGVAGVIGERDARAWFLEHQPELPLG